MWYKIRVKETLINQGRDRSRNHNVVWARVDWSGNKYTVQIHPHGPEGRSAAQKEAANINQHLKKTGKGIENGELIVGSLGEEEVYMNQNYAIKIHGETDKTKHILKRVRGEKSFVLANPNS